MRSDDVDLRDGTLTMQNGPRDDADTMQSGDIVPLRAESDTMTFDTVLRGYNKVQVEDYMDRVEQALSEADQRHAEDGERFAAFQAKLSSLNERVQLAEQRAAGQPEPASLIGERLRAMLLLAEQEADALQQAGQDEADRVVADARRRADREIAERLAELEVREQEVASSQQAADADRLQAQADADQLRETTRREIDELLEHARATADKVTEQAEDDAARVRAQAEEDVRSVHEQARKKHAADVEKARQQVENLTARRDAIGRELQSLRDHLAAIAGPAE